MARRIFGGTNQFNTPAPALGAALNDKWATPIFLNSKASG
jgi:hypothetical protein